jgi:four helix bundle protein
VGRRIRRHDRLRVWRSAMDLSGAIYRYTAHLPKAEQFGLTAQMRRASVSVPSNIAEGVARVTDPDQMRFLVIARASLAELVTQVDLCEELGLSSRSEEIDALIDQTFGELNALIKRCGW